jgi:hypothetical protein
VRRPQKRGRDLRGSEGRHVVVYRSLYTHEEEKGKTKHIPGVQYMGQVHPHVLPQYHVLEIDDMPDIDILKTHLSTDWISVQVPQHRPNRGTFDFIDHDNSKKVKERAFRSIIEQSVGKDFMSYSSFHKRFEDEDEEDTVWNKLVTLMNTHNTEQKPWDIVTDPLFYAQWHIHGNTYDRFKFSTLKSLKNKEVFHLNLAPVWFRKGEGDREIRILGRGVVISIIGDGVNYYHSDLNKKFVEELSIDLAHDVYVTQERYSAGIFQDDVYHRYHPKTIRRTNRTDYGMASLSQPHGTSVASLAAGSPNDGTCGSGVAPMARVSSIRLLDATHMVTELQEATALSYKCIERSGMENMIYVSSWGPPDGVSRLPISMSELGMDAIRRCSENGRRGLGSIYVQAAGNGRAGGDTVDLDGYASNRYTISVGAMTYTGYPTTYTEGGESLMVLAPSAQGPMGISAASSIGSFYATRVAALRHFIRREGKNIDINRAYSAPSEDGCTSSFGGTSAAAPQIAGLIALMLEANPRLTWKDVHDILIKSAEKPHLDYSEDFYRYRDTSIRTVMGRTEPSNETSHRIQENFFIFFDSPDILEWLVNDETGLHHSFLMGFGLPNGERAVNLARDRDTPIDNDYVASIGGDALVQNRRYYYLHEEHNVWNILFGSIEEKNKVGYKEIGVWYVEDLGTPRKIYGNEHGNKNKKMMIETVELYVNATFPASIDNVQLALCDHQKVCSLFIRGKDYDSSTIEPDHIDYTFTTMKHWGQTLDDHSNWSIMLRNNYPFRYARIIVHSMELRVYGHY